MTQPKKLFAKIGGKTVGPLALSDVKSLAEAGRVTPETEVTGGDGRWVKAGEVEGLFRPEPTVIPEPRPTTVVEPPTRPSPPAPSVASVPRHGLLESAAVLCVCAGLISLVLGVFAAVFGFFMGNPVSIASGVGSALSGTLLCLLGGLGQVALQIASDLRITRDVVLRIEMRGRTDAP